MTKVLLLAPSCDGTDVGEAWVAHQWAAGLSRVHDVTVLSYRQHGRPSAVEQLPDARVVEWDQPVVFSRWPRLNSMLKPWYPFYYRHCRTWIRAAQARGETFDVAHQPTPVAMRYPSPLAGFSIPFVLGPVGGSLESPPAFEDEDTAPLFLSLRRLDAMRMTRDPLLRRSYRSAAVVLGIAPYVADLLAPLGLRDLRIMSETAIVEAAAPVDRSRRTGPVRLLFVGRVIRTKGARDAVAAMQHLKDLDVVLDVVGDGFDREACERLAGDLSVRERVRFHGRQPKEKVEDFYRAADVFVFPSYREPGGNVQFEAMSYGLPLIVSDRGGPASVVDDSCAITVRPVGPDAYAEDIAAAVRALVLDPARRRFMGRHARDLVLETGTWSSRIAAIERVYASIAPTVTAP